MKQDIDFWIKSLSNQPKERIKQRLEDTLRQIDFLESIYMTGKCNNTYSKEFGDAAYKERQSLCQITSALYQIQRTQKELEPSN